jgi:hypothetical protein
MTTDSPSVQPSGKALSAAERMRAYSAPPSSRSSLRPLARLRTKIGTPWPPSRRASSPAPSLNSVFLPW